MHTHQGHLDNGMKVIVSPAASLQTVGISLGVEYGFVDDLPRKIGVSHYMEHMLFKGTKRRTWKEIEEETKRFGIDKNAFTDSEYTVYIMTAYKGYLNKALEILSDMMRNSTLPEKEFVMEKGPIVNEILIFHDNPASSDMSNGYLPKVLFKRHPARNTSIENARDTREMRRDDLMRVYNSYYGPGNMVLSMYGGISAGTGMKLARKYFGPFRKQTKKLVRHTSRERQERTTMIITRRGVKQTRIGIGFKTAEFQKSKFSEYLSSLVVERLLQHRLFEEVREKRGLSYEPFAKSYTYSTYGFIGAEAGVEQRNLQKAEEVMLREFEKLQDGEIRKKEMDTVKNELRIGYMIARERSLDMSIWGTISKLVEGDARLPERMPELIGRVTLDGARAYCSKYIDVDKYSMYVLKPR